MDSAKILMDTAIESGASAAKLIRAEEVVLDPRVKFKCLVPICPGFNQNKMCPPTVMSMEEFRVVLSSYKTGIFVQRVFADTHVVAAGEKLSDMYMNPAFQEEKRTKCLLFYEILEAVERKALQLGFPFTAGLGEGPCRVCTTCSIDSSCPVPFKARPSMEAVGINVIETAMKAGCPIEIKHEFDGTYTYNGLVLVD